MKRYLLLRNNCESGPYSPGELATLGLRPLDLIWIEGESTSWSYPTEITDLRSSVSTAPAPAPRSRSGAPAHIHVSMPLADAPRGHQRARHEAPAPAAFATEPLRERPVDEDPKPVWKKKMVLQTNGLLNVFLVFVGMAACALVMKKLVDSSGDTAVAQQPATAVPWPAQEEAPVEKTVPTPPVPLPMASTAVEKTPLKTVRLTDLRRKMSVSANQYSVGLFGGISNLKLTVSNGSLYRVDRTLLSVSYLKPGGQAVDSATYEVPALQRGARQTISIPHSGRGVRVSYRILRIYSQEYKNALKGLAQVS